MKQEILDVLIAYNHWQQARRDDPGAHARIKHFEKEVEEAVDILVIQIRYEMVQAAKAAVRKGQPKR